MSGVDKTVVMEEFIAKVSQVFMSPKSPNTTDTNVGSASFDGSRTLGSTHDTTQGREDDSRSTSRTAVHGTQVAASAHKIAPLEAHFAATASGKEHHFSNEAPSTDALAAHAATNHERVATQSSTRSNWTDQSDQDNVRETAEFTPHRALVDKRG